MKKVFSLDFKVLIVAFLVVTSMTLGSLILFKRLADQAQGLLFDAMDAMSYAVHHAIAGQFYERYYDVQAFARNAAIQSMDPARMEQALNTYVGLYEIYDLILIIDDQGRLVATNTRDPQGAVFDPKPLFTQDFSGESWFQAVKQGQLSEQPEHHLRGTFVDKPMVDPLLQILHDRKAITNVFAAAITDGNGHLLGVICNRAGVRWIEREFQNAYHMFQSGGFSEARLELIDAEGQTLVNPQPDTSLPLPEIPTHYPGTADRLPDGKTWTIKKGPTEDLMIGSAPIADSKFVRSLGWGLRITAGASSASRRLASTVHISYGLIFIAAGAILFLAVGYSRRLLISRFLQQEVEKRTEELRQTANDLEARNDELELNKLELLETNNQLILAQKELLDTAKRLGQSEVAALTLHNIGNIITSLNIQSTLLREHMEQDAPGHYSLLYLKKIEAEGLDQAHYAEHVHRIEAAELSSIENIKNLIKGLIDNVRMAMSAISSQVSFVQHSEPAEEFTLSALIRNTVLLYEGTFKRHKVKLAIHLHQDALFSTERFRFESVLTVLIRNAIDATEGMEDRHIHFYTGLDETSLILAIEDNGHGFKADIAGKLFRFGFTTKEKGHGFGLHYAANSCKHLGIQLKLESPGEGQGATASLLIPRESLLSMTIKS